MSKTIVYVKHAAEEVYVDCSVISYTEWHRTHELVRDPSVSVEDFYSEV
jgi:hypothetical protein